MTSVLDALEPSTTFAIWGYDLRGEWVLEFSALIAEKHDSYGAEWDRPEWRRGELWNQGKRVSVPFTWALPWVSDIPPSRSMWRRKP